MKTYEYQVKVAAIHKARINVKSLAAEAKLIRQETQRAGEVYRNMLSNHRRTTLRQEARIAHLVLAFLRGRPYRTVEASHSAPPDARRIIEKAKRYLYTVKAEQVLEWLR